jgi:hypothetical protein
LVQDVHVIAQELLAVTVHKALDLGCTLVERLARVSTDSNCTNVFGVCDKRTCV